MYSKHYGLKFSTFLKKRLTCLSSATVFVNPRTIGANPKIK